MPGDAEAFTTTYQVCVPRIRAYLARRVDSQVVDDLTADVFAVAWKKRRQVTLGEELPWLYRIASYVVANHRRKQAKNADLLRFFQVPDTSPSADQVSMLDPELEKAWKHLSVKDREVLSLVIIEDVSVTDAAKALQTSPNAVSIRLHRAKKNLAELLGSDSSTPAL